MKAALILACFAAATSAVPAMAQTKPAEIPAVFSRVTACRSVADPAERLACFDREVSALAQAQASQQLVVVDQEQIRETRRGLFGLRLPNIGRLFDHEQGPQEITAKIARVGNTRTGLYSFELEDGSVWNATESRTFSREPRVGMEIRIRQAALGSYMANIAQQRAIRVSRVR